MNDDTMMIDYPVFDRQLGVFSRALEAFMAGWTEYSATELTLDLRSLCIKAARLCYMADMDDVAQSDSLTNERSEANHVWFARFNTVLTERLSPLMMRVVSDMKESEPLKGIVLPRYKGQFADILPHLGRYVVDEGDDEQAQCFDRLVAFAKDAKRVIVKGQKKKAPQGETQVERLWHLCQLYSLVCYMFFHFKTQTERNSMDMDEEELGRLFVLAMHHYMDSDSGRQALDTFRARLYFDHDEGQLSKDVLIRVGKELVDTIPAHLQLLYINHRSAPERMAKDVVRLHPTSDDLHKLTEAVAKWEMLSMMIHAIDHSQKAATIPNTIFRTEMRGIPVDLVRLRDAIGAMARLVERKNQWFCVWCVLKHHNLLGDLHFEAFAKQMMHAGWFGGSGLPAFKGDNLSDYHDYFGETDYRQWDFARFKVYRGLHGKSEQKWSDTLFNTFHHLCYDMDDAFTEIM